MSLEVELKFTGADLARVRERLAKLGGRTKGSVFESNVVYDDAEQTLRAGRILLRLRRDRRGLLTLKLPPAAPQPGDVKVLEEIETGVEDLEAMERILAGLGYAPALAYEKVREEWEVSGCHVCLDILPFGDFVEIEAGSREAVFACARELGLDPGRASTANYHTLHLAWRRERGLAEEDSFVFPEPRRTELLARLGQAPGQCWVPE
jgi:adenylate cyclase class 2